MNEFFQKLTVRNWGLPWHYGLSKDLAAIVFLVGYYFFNHQGLLFVAIWTMIFVNIVGYVNEVVEKRGGHISRTDFWEDMAANNVGAALIVLMLCLLVKITI